MIKLISIILGFGLVLSAQASTIVYQDTFDDTTRVTNSTGIGGGMDLVQANGSEWAESSGQIQKTGGGAGNRASVWTTNTFDLSNGFKLDVNWTFDKANLTGGAQEFSFGVLAGFAAVGNNNVFTPQGTAENVDGIGFEFLGNTDGTTYPVGLILCESGGTDTSFTTLSTITRPTDAALTAHSMILTVTPDGFGGADWSYSFDGGTVTNGNIASFDFTTENFVFYAHARDDEVIRAIQDVTLTAFAPWGLEVYRDTYNDGDRVTNPDVGGGLSNSGVSGGNWNENNPDYITGVGNVPNRANAYTVGYNLSLGFKLDVDYSWTVDTGGNNQFAFGVFADFVANAHYENGFVNATKNLSGIGFNLMPGADVDDEGLILAEKDGGGVGTTGFTLLDADVTASGAHNLTLTVVPDGSGGADWSYTYDRGVVANGNIASFDFSPDNGFSFIVYGRDNDGEKQVHKVRLIARRCLGSTFRF